MANLSDFLKSSTARGALGEPGSNGFWRREIYSLPGTYTWTAAKSGKVKIQAIGAASGRSFDLPGNPGHYGEKLLDVVAGQTLTIVVGRGGDGVGDNIISGSGGTTSISGAPIGGTPLTLPGAPSVYKSANNHPVDTRYGVATFPSGPWDKSFPGGVGSERSIGRGGPASASPFGPGVHTDPNTASPDSGFGGHGWGGRSSGASGASSFCPGTEGAISAPGRVASSGGGYDLPGIQPWWDLLDVDSAGGAEVAVNSNGTTIRSHAGPGAGGAGGSTPGVSSLGGGSGYNAGTGARAPRKSGNGAGGAAAQNGSGGALRNGDGGDAFVMIFWDEVF